MIRIKNSTTIDSTSGLQTVLELKHLTTEELAIEVANSNDQNLSAFAVQVRFHESGDYQTIASLAADFTSPQGFMWAASGSLVTLAKNTNGWMVLKGFGVVESLRIQATAAAATTTLTITGQAR